MDTSGPTDALRSTETAGTGTPSTIGDVTATSESTVGGKQCVIITLFVRVKYCYTCVVNIYKVAIFCHSEHLLCGP